MLAGRKRRLLGLGIAYLPTVWLSRTSLLNNLGYTRKLELQWWGNAMGDKEGVPMGTNALSITKFIEEKVSLRKKYEPDTVLGLEIHSFI